MAHGQRFVPIDVSRHISFQRVLVFLGIFFVFFCLLPLNVQAGEVTLAWDPPSTEYGGFILAYGTGSGTYTYSQDVGRQTVYTIPNLNPGQTYYFAVKAYTPDRANESPYSNQIMATLPAIDITPPAPPKNVQIN